MGTYARRSPLRFLAPVALLAFGLALLLIFSSGGGNGGETTQSASEKEKQRDLGSAGRKETKKKGDGALPTRTYTVKEGDTLGSISEKTGIPVEKLQELNPQLDPQQMTTGQKVKLRE